MCGIAGIVEPTRDAIIDGAIIRRMTRSLAHRGPDGEGFFEVPGVALGHRRLSIIDIEGGTQPMFANNGDIAIVFNGEIYNYKELREDLLRNGVVFDTKSDTEVILKLYERFGQKCLQYLNGMFAFAIWDDRNDSLFIARDRMGEKPLYYTTQDGKFVFGSELKAVLAYREEKPAVDLHALDDYLAYGYVPAPRTIFQEIFKLEPAHCLLFSNGNLNIVRYWNSSIADAPEDISDVEAEERLLGLLNDAVRIRLRSDVPVGSFLSGGVDSGLITMLAAENSDSTLATYTVRFNEASHDESDLAREVADRAGTDHNEILVTDFGLHDLPALVRQFDEPFADPSSLPTYYVSRAASQDLKVCLSGDAGDELFGGYTRYRYEPLEKISSRLPDSVSHMVFGGASSIYPRHWRGHGWLSRLASTGAIRYQLKNGVFSATERKSLCRDEIHPCIDEGAGLFHSIYVQGKGIDEISRRMQVDQETYLPEDILVKVDRTSMLNSLEMRVPLLDHRVVELANNLGIEFKIREGEQKFLLRRIASRYLTPKHLSAPKRGFGLPLRSWFKDRKADEMLHGISSESSHVANYLHASRIERLVDRHRNGYRDHGAQLWSLLWLELWFREVLGAV